MASIRVDVDVDIEDYLDEVSDDDLVEELESRGYKIIDKTVKSVELKGKLVTNNENPALLEGNILYRFLCDVAGVGYHYDKAKLLSLIWLKF